MGRRERGGRLLIRERVSSITIWTRKSLLSAAPFPGPTLAWKAAVAAGPFCSTSLFTCSPSWLSGPAPASATACWRWFWWWAAGCASAPATIGSWPTAATAPAGSCGSCWPLAVAPRVRRAPVVGGVAPLAPSPRRHRRRRPPGQGGRLVGLRRLAAVRPLRPHRLQPGQGPRPLPRAALAQSLVARPARGAGPGLFPDRRLGRAGRRFPASPRWCCCTCSV